MSEEQKQSYAHHARRQPAFHFFLIPVLILNFIFATVYDVRHPSLTSTWMVILGLALLVLAFLSRMNAVKVQDRVIRLEERLRLSLLLPGNMQPRILELTERQLIALRFASDAEIPQLVEETLQNNLGSKEIKKRIQNWRPDHFRI